MVIDSEWDKAIPANLERIQHHTDRSDMQIDFLSIASMYSQWNVLYLTGHWVRAYQMPAYAYIQLYQVLEYSDFLGF